MATYGAGMGGQNYSLSGSGLANRPLCGPDTTYNYSTGQCEQTQKQQLVTDLRKSLNLGGSGSTAIATAAPKAPSIAAAPAPVASASGGPLPGVPAPVAPSSTAGSNAALLRAKERAGQIAQSGLTGLREALGARQMLGSGAEAQATGDLAATAMGSIADVNREQLIQDDETARRMAELSYQGSISQRGQDITARGQDVTARGQDISASLAQQNAQAAAYYDQQRQILDALKALSY